jgi:hypothetical protein
MLRRVGWSRKSVCGCWSLDNMTCLHFLKLLKNPSVAVDDLLQYYKSVNRPIVEYASPVRPSGHILSNSVIDLNLCRGVRWNWYLIRMTTNYNVLCKKIESIRVRLDNLARSFIRKICRDCLNYFLPGKRPTQHSTAALAESARHFTWYLN